MSFRSSFITDDRSLLAVLARSITSSPFSALPFERCREGVIHIISVGERSPLARGSTRIYRARAVQVIVVCAAEISMSVLLCFLCGSLVVV